MKEFFSYKNVFEYHKIIKDKLSKHQLTNKYLEEEQEGS